MIRLTVKFDADRSFRGWCDEKAKGLRRWAHGPIGGGAAMLSALEAHHEAVFASAGAASGYGPWSALRGSTLRSRGARIRCSRIAPRDYAGAVGTPGILSYSWRLRKSLTTKGNAYGDAIRVTRATGITFGTATPTALFHAAGRKGRNPMPVRMPLDDKVGPAVALDAAEARIMAFLFSDTPRGLPSPGLRFNAAGFYSRY